MANGDTATKWMGFISQVGVPGALLFLVSIGLYYLADNYLATQTEVLREVSKTISDINVAVEADRAENKVDLLKDIKEDMQQHDKEVNIHLGVQTKILEKLSDIAVKQEVRNNDQ
jgi:uncharacterized membrane protein (DUF106 family)